MQRVASLLVFALLVAAALGQDYDEKGRFIAKAPAENTDDESGDWGDWESFWNNLRMNKISLIVIELLGLGFFGLDRFWVGSYITGTIKLVTGGGFGIWFLVDYCLIMFNGVMGYDSLNILWMSKTFSSSSINPAQWVSIIGLVLTFCMPGVFTCVFGTGFLGSLPIVGRFFRKDEPTLIEHNPEHHGLCC